MSGICHYCHTACFPCLRDSLPHALLILPFLWAPGNAILASPLELHFCRRLAFGVAWSEAFPDITFQLSKRGFTFLCVFSWLENTISLLEEHNPTYVCNLLSSNLKTSWLLLKPGESGHSPMDTVCRVLCRHVSHASEKYRGMWLLNSLGRNCQSTFPKGLHHFYFLTSNKYFLFPHFFTNIGICVFIRSAGD